MKPLPEIDKKKLRAAGRQDLIDTHELLMSGYAGVDKTGKIVDRRKFPDAVPMPEGGIFENPKPKELTHGKE